LTGIKFAEGYDDRYANTHTPTISGWSEAGVTIQIQIGSRSYSFTTPSNRQWHFKVPYGFISSSNTYQYITFIATDAAGNKTTQTIKFTFLKSTPVIEADISKETDTDIVGDKITSNRKPTLTGTVSCKDQTAAQISKAKVSLYINGKMYENISVDSSGKWSFELPTELDNGKTYNYTVFVTDFVGNTGSYESYITISTLSGALAAESITGLTTEQITSDNTPTLSGYATPGSHLEILINDKVYGIKMTNDSNVWSWTSESILGDGTYNYKITEKTSDGKTNVFTGVFSIDTQAPDTLLIELEDHVYNEPNKVNRPDFIMKGKTEALALVTISVAGVVYKTYANESGEWSYSFDKYTFDINTQHSYIVTASDAAGNKKEHHGVFYIDTINVEASVEGGVKNGNESTVITNNSTPKITGKTEPESNVSVVIDGKTYKTTSNSSGEWTITVSSKLTDNTHAYTVTVEKNGKTNYFTGEVIIDTIAFAPEFQYEYIGENKYLTNEKSSLTGKAEPASLITLVINNNKYTATTNSDGIWSVDISLDEGIYDYSITSVDKAGNASESSEGTLKIDHTAPVITEFYVSYDNEEGVIFYGKVDDANVSMTISFE
ncbi:hypothetical protein MWU01_005085, partial [Escherichia coli]|nr:hypothetical protein [Escherichia coli]